MPGPYRAEHWGETALRIIGPGVIEKFEGWPGATDWRAELTGPKIAELLNEAFEQGRMSALASMGLDGDLRRYKTKT